MRRWLIALTVLGLASPAAAERMVFAGGLPPSVGASAPTRFVLDVEVWPVPNTDRHELAGWLAMLQPRAQGWRLPVTLIVRAFQATP